jgi:hypothetical protein
MMRIGGNDQRLKPESKIREVRLTKVSATNDINNVAVTDRVSTSPACRHHRRHHRRRRKDIKGLISLPRITILFFHHPAHTAFPSKPNSQQIQHPPFPKPPFKLPIIKMKTATFFAIIASAAMASAAALPEVMVARVSLRRPNHAPP